jgi:hypothetical protein
MAEVPLKILNPDETPNTGLTKSRVNFKKYENGAFTTYIDYNDLVKMNEYGNYVANGVSGWQWVGLFIDDTQQYWWGMQYVGEPASAFVSLDGSTPMTGDLELPGNPDSDLEAATKQYVDDKADSLQSDIDVLEAAVTTLSGTTIPRLFQTPEKIIFVSVQYAGNEVAGKRYDDIQSAIDYAASQTPSNANRFKIFITPHSSTAGYAGNITLQPYVDLIGLGFVFISGSMSGANANTKLINIRWAYSGNFTIQNLILENCIFTAVTAGGPIITITGNKLKNCGFYAYASEGGGSPAVVSEGNNYFFGADNHSNCEFVPDSTDKGLFSGFGDPNVTYPF